MAETVFETINMEADKVEHKRRAKHKFKFDTDEKGKRILYLLGYINLYMWQIEMIYEVYFLVFEIQIAWNKSPLSELQILSITSRTMYFCLYIAFSEI